MNRNDWREDFDLSEGQPIPWPCPACAQRALSVASGSIHIEETASSKAATSEEAWDPEWTERRFVCLLKCACSETVAVAGVQHVEEAFFATARNGEHTVYIDVSKPRFFEPALRIIEVSANVPREIRDELETSFVVFWCDLESCANRLRASVEKLMDHDGIAKTYVSGGKRRPLALHSRIQRYATIGGAFGEELTAVKWLGNAGSHSAAIRRDDVFDGYDIVEHVLREIFEQPAKRIARIAKTINKTKKPRSVSRRTRRRT